MPTTFEKTWQMDMGRIFNSGSGVTNAKNALWYMKAFLKGEIGGAVTGLWTCSGSSDASTAGMDGTDRWGSSFNASKLVPNDPGSAHSWIVLHAPGSIGSALYMLLDYNHNANFHQMSLYFSRQPFTGGSTTARPTSSTEWSASANTWFQQNFHDNSGTDWVVNGFLTTEGSFHFLMNAVGGGDTYSSVLCHKLMEVRTEDILPVVAYFNSGGGVYNRGTIAASSMTRLVLRCGNDSMTSLTASFVHWLDSGNGIFFETIGVDNVSGGYDDLPIPIFVWTPVNAKSMRGRLADVKWAPQSLPNGSVEPSLVAPVSMVVNDVWMPCNAVPIL